MKKYYIKSLLNAFQENTHLINDNDIKLKISSILDDNNFVELIEKQYKIMISNNLAASFQNTESEIDIFSDIINTLEKLSQDLKDEVNRYLYSKFEEDQPEDIKITCMVIIERIFQNLLDLEKTTTEEELNKIQFSTN